MSIIERITKQYEDQKRSVIEVEEWGEGDQPLCIFYDPPTLSDSHLFNKKSDGNSHLALCQMIVRKAMDEDGNLLFSEGDAQSLYTFADERVVSRIGLQMKQHHNVADQVKN
ncbi:hypothetical protein [Maritalea myrionectae]|uniref:hypothetical protein n=1 Tax=Maritalea myrionectae TaxID=454601 RepID=UPI0004203152|nr:hypothetical protein [Maritalea myrionectae]